jgi:hypothetical protein
LGEIIPNLQPLILAPAEFISLPLITEYGITFLSIPRDWEEYPGYNYYSINNFPVIISENKLDVPQYIRTHHCGDNHSEMSLYSQYGQSYNVHCHNINDIYAITTWCRFYKIENYINSMSKKSAKSY